jgi:hypothetical protein
LIPTISLAISPAKIKMLYEELLPTLGYDFLSQFNEVELLSFLLQARDFNIDLSLEQFLTTASLHSLCTLPLAFIPFLPSHGKLSFYPLQFAFVPFPLSNGIHSLYTRAFAFVFYPLSQRKQEFFSSIKLKTALKILFIPKMFEVSFLTSI